MTKREMMVEAHRMAREELEGDYQARLSLALRHLWKEKKEENKMSKLAELEGTEKQISYAEDIREDLINLMKKVETHTDYVYSVLDEKQTEEFKEQLTSFNQRIRNEKNSVWFIENFGIVLEENGVYFKGEKMAYVIRNKEMKELSSWDIFFNTYFKNQYRG